MSNYSSFIHVLSLILISSKLLAADGATLLETVCRQTEEPSFCTTVLGSDPRSFQAFLPGLASIAIDLATNNATGTKVKVHTLFLAEKDPVMRASLDHCQDYYIDALDALGIAVSNLKVGQYVELNVMGAAVYSDGSDCEKMFKPPFQSPLTNENNDAKRFGELIAVIANLLDAQGPKQ